MNIGTVAGGGITRVGARGFFMVSSHVAHDCDVGDGVTFANNAVIGGHVSVGDNVFLGGNSAVHQFVRIGEGVMLGGLSGAPTDVIPFSFGFGRIGKLVGLNVVGLRRRGASRTDLRRLRDAYRALFQGDGVFADRIDKVATVFADDPLVQKVIAFIRAGGKRPLMHPAVHAAEDGEADGL
jgi:UDP-N-acetylglucosamine acyltransferase